MKNQVLLFIFLIFTTGITNSYSNSEIFIKVKVDNEIITNHDIIRESNI